MDNPEFDTHHHHHTGARWLDLVLGGSAILISLISLFVAVQHGKTMEKLVEANTLPYVEAANSNETETGQKINRLIVINSGIGPAKIQSFEVFYKGRPMRSADDLLKACCNADANEPDAYIMNSSVRGRLLPARETIQYLGVTPDDPKLFSAFGEALHSVSTRICYCSVFDECWMREPLGDEPHGVKSCPTPAVPYHG